MRLLVIVNPISGKGHTKVIWPLLQDRLDRLGTDYRVVWTERPGHAISVSKQAVHSGFSRILSVGGDGTLREVVQGALHAGVEIGLIPAGSGNDFSRTVGLPTDPLRSLDIALGRHVEMLNVGELNGSVYVNVAGCGFDAEVAALAAGGLRFLGGKLSYLVSAFVQLSVYKPRRFRISIDGETVFLSAYLVAAANGRYCGGGMMIAPDADPADGLLDVCIIRKMSRARLAVNLQKVYSGRHVDDPFVEMRRGRYVTVEADGPVQCQADGEILDACPIEFRVSKRSIRLVCPTGGATAESRPEPD